MAQLEATQALVAFTNEAQARGLGRYEVGVTLALRAAMLVQDSEGDRIALARYFNTLARFLDREAAEARSLH